MPHDITHADRVPDVFGDWLTVESITAPDVLVAVAVTIEIRRDGSESRWLSSPSAARQIAAALIEAAERVEKHDAGMKGEGR